MEIAAVQQCLLIWEVCIPFDAAFLHLGIYPTDIVGHVKNQVHATMFIRQKRVNGAGLKLLF